MPLKAPPPAPAPVYNWTGWYVGGNLGASFGHVKTDFNGAPNIFTLPVEGPFQITPGLGGSDISHPSGFIGGVQIGYNWQYSPLIVVGLEADIQGALERETNNFGSQFNFFNSPITPEATATCGTAIISNLITAAPCTAATSYTTQIDWFGTVRGRIGYLWGDGAVLTYLTGGLAYGEVKINGTNTVSGAFGITAIPGCGFAAFGCQALFSHTETFSQSHVNTGWVVGYGMEGKLLIPGWTYKIESLYMDLGDLDSTSVTTAKSCNSFCGSVGVNLSGGRVTAHSHFTDGILRLGVNYQFH